MAGQCTICLSEMNDPVCIPCGHLYCSQCLSDYIASSSEDGYTTLCPTCRALFSIVSPELTCLPKHVHRYITPSIRRVYLDSSAVQSLQQKLVASQNQVRNLKKESERLMLFCEKYQNASDVHADGEAKARLEVERLTRLLREQKLATEEAEEETLEWKERHDDLKKQLKNLRGNVHLMPGIIHRITINLIALQRLRVVALSVIFPADQTKSLEPFLLI
ncbi:hypothetical protein GGU10DRAFT_163918 [Lentinula aff. detonsa]|uniref:RING-type domain-containing protein n=1 Tax=Lentinula aff. detonsa TaxID=2804958 RepID=A0AA38NMG7_9AGAR|nr:hypothetical protein GGU10DRAFT_163918 [Lentinula aff. detonsa]